MGSEAQRGWRPTDPPAARCSTRVGVWLTPRAPMESPCGCSAACRARALPQRELCDATTPTWTCCTGQAGASAAGALSGVRLRREPRGERRDRRRPAPVRAPLRPCRRERPAARPRRRPCRRLPRHLSHGSQHLPAPTPGDRALHRLARRSAAHQAANLQAERKDLRDIVTLLADIEVVDADGPGEAAAGEVDGVGGAAGQMSMPVGWTPVSRRRLHRQALRRRLGPLYDVTMNLQRVGEAVARFDLERCSGGAREPGSAATDRRHRRRAKSLRWRLRARVGTRKIWHSELDDQE